MGNLLGHCVFVVASHFPPENPFSCCTPAKRFSQTDKSFPVWVSGSMSGCPPNLSQSTNTAIAASDGNLSTQAQLCIHCDLIRTFKPLQLPTALLVAFAAVLAQIQCLVHT